MSAYHQGEMAMQEKFSMRESMASVGNKAIRSFMPDQHREFFSLLPYILVGSVDEELQPTASILTGEIGFVTSPSEMSLQISAHPLLGDALNKNLQQDKPLGILGIQNHTRRRNRMNGLVAELNDDFFSLNVQQSFGNCPKYIVPRQLDYVLRNFVGLPEVSDSLSQAQCNLITQADTFYLATAHPNALDSALPNEGLDVSHRGGLPGFVEATENFLRIPDYRGNYFFNSFGNLALNPKAGLIFFDYLNNDIVQLEVDTKLVDSNSAEKEAGVFFWLWCQVKRVKHFRSALNLQVIE